MCPSHRLAPINKMSAELMSHAMSIMQAIGLLYMSEMVLSFLYTVVWKAMLRPGKNLSKRYVHTPWL